MPVLSVQSHVSYGPVGNAAATFALQRLGHEVWPVHTVAFATHTGYGPPTGTVTAPETIRDIVARLDREGVLARCDAVLTGYVGSAGTGAAILEAVATVKARNPAALWCCDPVMGDDGRGLFVDGAVAAFFADHAASADILLPNRFELARLTGIDAAAPGEVGPAARALLDRGVGLVVATGLRGTTDSDIVSCVAGAAGAWSVAVPAVPLAGRPNGAGDLFAAVFLGRLLSGAAPEGALAHAAGVLHGILGATATSGAAELALVAAQDEIVRPARVPAPVRLW